MPYSTFFVGSSFEVAYDLEFDARETLTFCGRSGSPNLPLTSDAIEGVSGGFDAILVQLQPDLGLPPTDQLVYSTYYRGSANEYFFDIALEDSGRITAVGASQSGTMPRAGEAFEHEFSNWSIIVAGFSADIRKSFLRGDCNDDGTVNISDAACILNWLFAGEDDPGCVAATNTNGDEAANITDATYLLNHLFAGGPAPVAPFPDCGPGTLPQELSCEDPPDCP
jgi:hypothetical protein